MIFTIIISLIIAVRLVLVFRFLNKPHKPPIFGIYQQGNKYYYFKFIVMYVFLRTKQLVVYLKRLLAVELGKSDDGNSHVHRDDVKLEEKFCLGQSPAAVDAVYFNGMTKEGAAVICGVARRLKNVCDAFLYLKVEGQELLLSPSLPDTYLKQNPSEEGEYKAQGIEVVNFLPMRTWKIVYNGSMKPQNSEKTVEVKADLVWSAHWTPFNYDWRMSPRALAGDMSREQWSVDYFRLLKKLHQTHYEQMGFIKGTVTINGKEHAIPHMPCVRDHTNGKDREWRNFHRYALHFMYLENGECLVVGAVSQPTVMSHITIGYVCLANQTVYPVDASDFKLYQHGESQVLPKDYGFTFEAGGESYAVRVQVNDETTFYIGEKRESKFYERWCEVEVNGIKGWGCAEWQYNNVKKQ